MKRQVAMATDIDHVPTFHHGLDLKLHAYIVLAFLPMPSCQLTSPALLVLVFLEHGAVMQKLLLRQDILQMLPGKCSLHNMHLERCVMLI